MEHWRGTGKASGKPYDFWACANKSCQAKFKNDNGKPGAKQVPVELSEHKCPDCGLPLIHRDKEGEGGYNFWGCSGFRDGSCKAVFTDDNGKPGDKQEPRAPKTPPSKFKCPRCKEQPW